MIARLFWIVSVLLMATAIHLAYILFLPQYELNDLYREIRDSIGANTLATLDRDQELKFLNGSDPALAKAICLLDVQDGSAELSARLPQSYWSLMVYDNRGSIVYSVNDDQVGSDRLVLNIQGSDEPEASNDETATTPIANGAVIRLREGTGLAVMSARAVNNASKRYLREFLKQSTCAQPKKQ